VNELLFNLYDAFSVKGLSNVNGGIVMAVLWRFNGLSSLQMTGSLFRNEFEREDAGVEEADDDGDSLEEEESSSASSFFGGCGHGFSEYGVWNLFGAILCASFLQYRADASMIPPITHTTTILTTTPVANAPPKLPASTRVSSIGAISNSFHAGRVWSSKVVYALDYICQWLVVTRVFAERMNRYLFFYFLESND
jgi:hypothetical protein